MTATRQRLARRAITALLVGLICTLPLTGCFVIPLIDDRSPFDDPFGTSTTDVANALPVVQEALELVDTQDGLWRYEVLRGQGNCEGACDLHVEVRVVPSGILSAYPEVDLESDPSLIIVPEQVLRDVLVAVVPAAEQQRVDVRVVPGNGDAGSSDLGDAADALLGPLPADGLSEEAFEVDVNHSDEVSVNANTRDQQNVLEAMGLA